PNSSLGEIIIELANMIACDVYYNVNGNLVISSGIADIAYVSRSTLWSYKDNELEQFETVSILKIVQNEGNREV
ncbi:MAG TPA: hypothetical protein PLU59_05130, partial [Aliarcobacter cryaerophilus]|nr:hypothetical protein [Aliarcobacter cryaerophilus]